MEAPPPSDRRAHATLQAWVDPEGRWGGWPGFAVAFTGSLWMALGSPPGGITALIWLGFFPLCLVARVVGRRRPKRAFALGWVGGLCVGLVGFPWIAELLERFADFPPSGALLGLGAFSAWTAIPLGVWVLGVAGGPRHGWRGLAWPVALWVALAAAWPSLFPYTVVIGFAEVPAWMQAAELGGVALVEAQVVAAGVLLADGVLAESRRGRWIRIAVAVAIPAVSWALGAWRMHTLDQRAAEAPHVRFGVVQPNVPLLSHARVAKIERLRKQSKSAQQEGAQVIVWPEAGAFPFRVTRPFLSDFRDPLRRVMLRHDAPTIFGAASIEPGGQWEYNSVFLMNADGEVTGTFDKVHLVPFGEYVPVVDPKWAMQQVPGVAHNFAGEGPARFEIEPAPTADRPDPPTFAAGPLVCYEDIFADFARETAAQDGGVDVFVNVTIDTWFGVTAEPWEHLALAQFRSVEHRIPMVRSVAAGPSSVVDHAGRLAAHLPLRGPTLEHHVDPARLVTDVALPRNTRQHPTVYARGGWLLPWLCGLGVVGVVVVHLTRRRGSREKDDADDRSPV